LAFGLDEFNKLEIYLLMYLSILCAPCVQVYSVNRIVKKVVVRMNPASSDSIFSKGLINFGGLGGKNCQTKISCEMGILRSER
jgi:hypothetical protein